MRQALSVALIAAVSIGPGDDAMTRTHDDLGARPPAQENLEPLLTEFLACTKQLDDISPCNDFVARALMVAYCATDLYVDGEPSKRALIANEAWDYLDRSDDWSLLGRADDDQALDAANGYADRGAPVVAVMRGSPHGHIAIVLPGPMSFSGSWASTVPNSASFFLNDPDRSYVGKHLAFAFASGDRPSVRLYTRLEPIDCGAIPVSGLAQPGPGD